MRGPRRLRFWVYLGLGALYTGIVLFRIPDAPVSDEARYQMFAANLANGYYSPPGELRLANGPGYPLVLLPFQVLGEFWLGARLLNVLFLLGAVAFLELTLARFVSRRAALAGALGYGLYPPASALLPLLMTEPLSQLLASVFGYLVCRVVDDGRRRVWLLAGTVLTALAMVKVLFGLVAIVSLGCATAFWGLRRDHVSRRIVCLFLVAVAGCTPYLAYTYSLTGRVGYWSSVGGSNLYWMASPFEGETGDWHGIDLAQLEESATRTDASLMLNHGDFFRSLEGLDQLARDDRFKSQAMVWIRDHPRKWIENWLHNLGRLWLGQPYSFSEQRLVKLATAAPASVLLFALVAASVAALRWRQEVVPMGPLLLLVVAAIGIGGTSVLSAASRLLSPFFPFLFLWVFATLGRLVRVRRFGG